MVHGLARRLAAIGMGLCVGACAPVEPTDPTMRVRSLIETLDVATGQRRVVYRTDKLIEAPNWTRDGRSLIYNGDGLIHRLPLSGGEPVVIDTGAQRKNNNDHGLSPDGRSLAISDNSEGPSRVFVVPLAGGAPRAVTPLTPSYWHGWSPDGRTLAFVGERAGNFDIYAIPVEGGQERRLTTDAAPDDGPDYAPDGTIFFNSARSGKMQIWRMRPDGGGQTRVTNDHRYGDWFPHPSPDGRWLVFLSYDGAVEGHPADKPITLRLMPLDGSAPPRVIASLFGGQGTINVPSWSPDSRSIAFVSYRPPPPAARADR